MCSLHKSTMFDLEVDGRAAKRRKPEIPSSRDNISHAPEKLIGVGEICIILVARIVAHCAKS
jgi:hypothetical protein